MKQKPEIVFKSTQEEVNKNIALHGFHIWYLTEKDSEYINAFTQGLQETFSHTDLQIVLPVGQEKCASIFHTLKTYISEGNTIETNQIHSGLLPFPFLAIEVPKSAHTQNLDVIRIVLPDSNGKFPHEDACDPHFKAQFN